LSMHLGRSFSWYDILANSFGAMGGIVIFKYGLRLRTTEKAQNPD